MAAHVGNMVRNRARGHLVPGSSARSLLATLKERLPDLASLSAGVRRGARTGALALAALAASVPGTGWASAGCDYLDANVLSSVTGTTLTGDFNTDPNPSLSAPNPFTAGAANFVSGDTVLYAYANLSNARATVRRAPSTGGFVTLVNGATIAGNGSYAVAADHTRFFVVTQVSSTGAGSVDFRMYCEIATTQAVASITATVGSGVSVTPVTAAYGSGARSYAVSPALPTGLSFNTSTGAITGTPTATSATTTYTVTASYTGGLGTSSKTFALTVNPPPPTVTAVSPNAGPTGGSTTVTITGTGFSIANNTGAVMFGPNPATYTIDSNTQITATAPAGSAGFVDVTVTTPGGTSTTSAADRYTYVAAPTVTAVSPIAGPIGGGTAVTITGTGFSAAAPTGAVKFGAALATYTIISNTQINATSPANAASTYDVTVTTPGGTSAISAADQFTYVAAPTVTSISPTAGPTSGGTTVTITGTGFSAANPTGAVKFGATLATYTINNNTQITATSPASLAGTYDVTVATPGGTSATSAADQYTYIAAPVASSFTASAVAYNGTGLTFSIAGHATNSPTNFAVGSATTAQGGSVSVNAAGLVTYDAPSGFRGNDSFTFTATNLGGTSAPATVTVPVSNPTLVSTLAGSGTRGIALSGVQINTSGGRATYSCSTTLASGALPLGTQLNGDCTVTGTPAASGNFTFTANVTDSSLGTGPFTQPTGSLTLSIAAPTVTLSPAAGALPGATVGTSYSQSFTGGGGTTGYTFARTSGALPTGLTLSAAGVITGTPTATGTSNFDVTVTDGSSAGSGGPYTATQSYSITVASGSQTISFAALPNASLSASPLTLSATATSGLTVSFASTTASVCTVSGTTLTLLQTGNCAITASQAGDANWAAATDVSRSFTVTPANLVLATGSASGLIVGGSYSQANTASGGLTPYTYSLNAGAFVPGTTLGSDGTVSGSPTVAGSFSYQIKVTDGQGTPVTTIGSIVTVTIAKGNQTITFASTAPTGATVGGATYAVSATTNAPLVVAFSSATPAVCTISGNTVSMVGTGTCTINADQAGDTNWNPAAQVQQSFTVGAAGAVTTSLSFSTASLGVGSTGTLTITFGNPNSSATPNIAPLLSGSALLSRVSGAPGGTCGASGADSGANYQFNVFSVPSGNCTVTLTYTGTTPGSVSGLVLGAFTPSGYPTTGSASSGSIAVVPTVTGVSPPSGPVSQVVTVSGTGFSTTPGNNTVTFGAAGNGTVTAASATSLTVTTPAVGSGAANLTVTVNGQTSTNSVAYTFIDKPIAANKPGVVIPYGSTGTPIDLSASITGGPHSSIAIGTAASHGTTSIAGDVVTYTPTAGYFGTDSFTYTATGAGGTSNVATVSLTVATPTAPTVADKNAAIPYNSTGTAIDLAPSIGGVYSTVAVATGPQHGTVTIAGTVVTYTPTTNYYGADSFTYTATGPGGTSAPATVTLAVATPPAPVAANKSGVGVPYASTGTAIDLSTSVTGVHSSIAIGTAPAHGTVTIAGDVVTYTPNPATYYGADSFTYTATGPGGTSAPATVSLTVATPPAPTVANKSGVAVPYASTGTAIDLSTSVTGVHSSIAIGTAPAHGTVTIAGDVVTYTPNPATYYGADSFTFTATGPGGTSAPATVSLTVATPAAPTAANKSGVAVAYNSSGTPIDLAPSVTGVHNMLTVVTAPAHGTTAVNGDVVTYTPTSGYFGADSFTYTVSGPGGTSAAATVSLTVATPPPPNAGPGTSTVAGSTTTAGTSVQINLSALVTGVYDSIQLASQPAHGTVTLSGGAGPSLTPVAAAPTSPYIATYTPAANFAGADSFTYVAVGPGGASAPGTVTITVVGQVPVAAPKTATAGDGQMVSVMLTDGAARGPFTGANVVSISPANSATTAIVATGNGTYRLDVTPNNRFGGQIVVAYTLSNVFGASAPSTVTLTVQARPDPRNDPDIAAISDAQAETTRRFARAQVSNFMRRAEQLHNGGGSAGLAMGVTLASRDGSAPMQRPDDKNWGLAITERMRVSGEDPAIGRVVNNPQSPLSRGDQLGSGRTIAGTGGAGTGGAGGADGAAGDDRAAPGKGAVDEDGNRRIGSLAIWAGGAIDIGTRDRRTDRSKITATTAGLSAGADIKLSEGVLVGLGGGYGNDLSRIGTAAQVRGTSTIYAAYASVQPASGTFIDGMIGRGQLDFTTRRIAQAVNATARGSRDGSYTIAAISLGIDRAEGPLQWSIYGRGEYMDADLDAYAESGAGRYNLRFDARQVRSITGTLGGRLQYRQKTGFGSITPRLRVEWNHEFANVDAQWLDYADIPGAAIYALAGNGWRREQLQLSFGTRFDILSSGWSFDFETGLRAAQGEKAGTLQLRLSKRW